MVKNMGKRCDVINDGKPCDFLAEDGSCLLDEDEMREHCPAIERVGHEDKDKWMNPNITNYELM